MSTGLPPQPQSTDSMTSLSAGTVCLLSCSSCQAGAKFGVQGSCDGCRSSVIRSFVIRRSRRSLMLLIQHPHAWLFLLGICLNAFQS